MMSDDGLERLRDVDAIYFGAVGAPDIPDDVILWGLRLRMPSPSPAEASPTDRDLLERRPRPR